MKKTKHQLRALVLYRMVFEMWTGDYKLDMDKEVMLDIIESEEPKLWSIWQKTVSPYRIRTTGLRDERERAMDRLLDIAQEFHTESKNPT